MHSTLREARSGGYESDRPDVQALVPEAAARVLDLGCASGALGAALKRDRGAEVVGIELDAEYARLAATRLDRVIHASLPEGLEAQGLGDFDCVIAADVLEHLVDPWATLHRAVALLRPGGVAVVSLPNVRALPTFKALLVGGRWPREPAGLFDATHLRWFTRRDAVELVEGSGLAVELVQGKLFYAGWQLKAVELLARTRLAPFLHGQYLIRAVRPHA